MGKRMATTQDLDRRFMVSAANRPAYKRLIRFLNPPSKLSPATYEYVEQERTEGRGRLGQNDFLWRGLVRAVTTVQGDRAYRNICTFPEADWSFDHIVGLSGTKRARHLKKLVGENSIYTRHVTQLLYNCGQLGDRRALNREQREIKQLASAQEKVNYFSGGCGKRFKGFGPKYSRNFWLDLDDEHVGAECFALDSRIQSVLAVIWSSFEGENGKRIIKDAVNRDDCYRVIERALLTIANKAEVTAGFADRALYRVLAPKSRERFLCWLRQGGAFPEELK